MLTPIDKVSVSGDIHVMVGQAWTLRSTDELQLHIQSPGHHDEGGQRTRTEHNARTGGHSDRVAYQKRRKITKFSEHLIQVKVRLLI